MRSSILKWTFGYAAVWGALTVVVALGASEQYPTRTQAIITFVLGLIVIVSGFGVYRGNHQSAWVLAGIASLDVAGRCVQWQGGVLLPLVLLILAVRSAFYLHRIANLPD